MKKILFAVFAFVMAIGVANVSAQMKNDKDIVDTAMATDSLSTLVTAVKAADLVATLKSAGPFTVFAPTNDAFGKVPQATLSSLLKPENKQMLTGVLTYHVVAGNLDSKAVAKAIKDGKGKAVLTTVQGGKLTAMLDGKNVVLRGGNGTRSTVFRFDPKTPNGVAPVTDPVFLPKM